MMVGCGLATIGYLCRSRILLVSICEKTSAPYMHTIYCQPHLLGALQYALQYAETAIRRTENSQSDQTVRLGAPIRMTQL
jgi:histidine ammonia-lyase